MNFKKNWRTWKGNWSEREIELVQQEKYEIIIHFFKNCMLWEYISIFD